MKMPNFVILHKKTHLDISFEIQLDYNEGGKLARNSNCNKQDSDGVLLTILFWLNLTHNFINTFPLFYFDAVRV